VPEDLGSGVMAFESPEEMFEYMQAANAAAKARITDHQRAIKPGSYVLRPVIQGGELVVIIGKTYSLDEYIQLERSHLEIGEQWDPEAERARYSERIDDGYYFGQWWSTWEPRGEFGDGHLSTFYTAIPEWLFTYMLQMIQGEI
jgi:hypothetical protein